MIEYDLIGDIGTDITAQGVSQMLKEANGEDVIFYAASLGGSLDHGQTIYGLIKKYPGHTKGVLIGNTASAMTIVIMGCDEVEANPSAPFLIHNSSDPKGGNAIELREKAAELERLDKIMLSIYREKTGLPDAKLIELMAREDWLMPEEAKELGFIDNVIASKNKAVAYMGASQLTNDLLIKLENKMKIFGKDKKDVTATAILSTKDGKQLLINAEVADKGVEVAQIGATGTLADGEYELADGRKIVVAGGIITEVHDPAVPAANADTTAIIEAVSKTVIEENAKLKNDILAEVDKKLAGITSKHIPAKGTGNEGKESKPSITAKISEITAKIHDNIQKAREA